MTFRCPCCERDVIHDPGSYEVCPICGWEDDPVQREDPDFAGGANQESLNVARIRWNSRPMGDSCS